MSKTQSTQPRRMKAEMWDRMQFLFRNYYDRMIHFYLKFDEPLDFAALSKAYKYVVDRIPVLHSSFINCAVTPYWKINYDYTEGDIISLKKVGSGEEAHDREHWRNTADEIHLSAHPAILRIKEPCLHLFHLRTETPFSAR